MKGYLADTNVLLALAWPNHPHHGDAERWLLSLGKRTWATCAVVELGFVRLSAHPSFTATPKSPAVSLALLDELTGIGHHESWAEPKGGARGPVVRRFLGRAVAHGQVTDAFLAAIASSHGGKVATFDSALKVLYPGEVELVAATR